MTGQTFTDPHELAIFGIFSFLGSLRSDGKPRLEIFSGTVRRRPGPRGCSCSGVDLRIEPWRVWEPGSGECSGAGIGNGVLPMIGDARRRSWRFVPSSPLTSRSARARHHDHEASPGTRSKAGNSWLSSPVSATSATSRHRPASIPCRSTAPACSRRDQPAGGGSFDVNVLGTTGMLVDSDDHASPAPGFMWPTA